MQGILLTPEVLKLIPEWGADAVIVGICLVAYSTDGKTSAPSYAEIREFTGLHKQTISNALKDLLRMGVITRQKRFSNSPIYSICPLVRFMYSILINTTNIYNDNDSNNNLLSISTTYVQLDKDTTPFGEPEEEQDEEPGPLAQLQNALIQATNMSMFGGHPEDIKAGKRMVENGITPEIIKEACDILLTSQTEYTILGLRSLEVTANNVKMRKEKRNGNQRKPRKNQGVIAAAMEEALREMQNGEQT